MTFSTKSCGDLSFISVVAIFGNSSEEIGITLKLDYSMSKNLTIIGNAI